MRFGRLVLQEKTTYKSNAGEFKWSCKCDCGMLRLIVGSALVRKLSPTKSCGCLQRDKARSQQGAQHPRWKGGRVLCRGYVRLKNRSHPNATKSGYVTEHVLEMSRYLGRPLAKGETVHHKNGIRYDNRIENLELRASQHGKGQRVEDLVVWAKEILSRYSPEDLKDMNACYNPLYATD